jgi:hypothetical protein
MVIVFEVPIIVFFFVGVDSVVSSGWLLLLLVFFATRPLPTRTITTGA